MSLCYAVQIGDINIDITSVNQASQLILSQYTGEDEGIGKDIIEK